MELGLAAGLSPDFPLGRLALVIAVAVAYRLAGVAAWRRYGRLGGIGGGALFGLVASVALLPGWAGIAGNHREVAIAAASFETALLPAIAALGLGLWFGLAAASVTGVAVLAFGLGHSWPVTALLAAIIAGSTILGRYWPAIAEDWLGWPWLRSIPPPTSYSMKATPSDAVGLDAGPGDSAAHWRPALIGVLPGLLLLPLAFQLMPYGITLGAIGVALHVPALWAIRCLLLGAWSPAATTSSTELLAGTQGDDVLVAPLLVRIIAELPEGIAVFDAADRLLACNGQYRALNRDLAADLEAGIPYATLQRAEMERRGNLPDLERALAQVMERHRNLPWRLEMPRTDGSWVQVIEQRIADGGTLRIMRDITATKTRELQFVELAQRNAVLASTVASVTSGVVICDATQQDHPIVFVNAAFSRITGYSAAEVTGRNCRFLQGRDTDKDALDRIRRALASGRAVTVTIRNYRKDGRTFWNDVSISPIHDESGQLIHFVGILQDVTNRIRTEENLRDAKNQAEVANRAKSEFLATVSHELRTPLNAIIGFSEIMLRELFGPLGAPRYQEYATDVHESGKHLLSIINDILDLSKIEAGRLELVPESVAAAEIFAASLRLVAGRAQGGGVNLRSSVPDDLPLLHVDRRAILQVLVNLLTNAVKFTPTGGKVELSARKIESGPASASASATWVEIVVADSGIGIAAKDLVKVMQPFAQVDSPDSQRQQGTGLGLPIAKALVERSGGEFKLESEPNRGTRVTLRLPILIPSAAPVPA